MVKVNTQTIFGLAVDGRDYPRITGNRPIRVVLSPTTGNGVTIKRTNEKMKYYFPTPEEIKEDELGTLRSSVISGLTSYRKSVINFSQYHIDTVKAIEKEAKEKGWKVETRDELVYENVGTSKKIKQLVILLPE